MKKTNLPSRTEIKYDESSTTADILTTDKVLIQRLKEFATRNPYDCILCAKTAEGHYWFKIKKSCLRILTKKKSRKGNKPA